jgi:hypothetical protein
LTRSAHTFDGDGLTVSRTVGKVDGETRFERLKAGRAKVRVDKIAEQNQCQWFME